MSRSNSSSYQTLCSQLPQQPAKWLVTGGAGFIGSHLVEKLLGLKQRVVVVDNFSTGYRANLEAVEKAVGEDAAKNLTVVEGDLRDIETCRQVCEGVEYILHQAALGSVPRSIDDPLASHANNVTATLNLFTAAKDAGIRRIVYASSSSVYGDEATLPKVEVKTGALLSPYAATKAICETYAGVFARCYGLETIGLRYFNVFGPRQDPDGPYAAVIPKWIQTMLSGDAVTINGDGTTSRDFTYVANAVQANLLAATVQSPEAVNRAYNVATGARTDLNQLAAQLGEGLKQLRPELGLTAAVHGDFRSGDIKHSLADTNAGETLLGYRAEVDFASGIQNTVDWFATASR